MKTRSGQNLLDVLKEALEAVEILENERTEIDYEEGFVWTRRAPGEHRFEIDVPAGEWICVGDIRFFGGKESKVTKIIQVHPHNGYARFLGLMQILEDEPDSS